MSKSIFFQKKELNKKNKFNIQQTIRLLPLPYEVVEIINSFCFYDLLTAKIRRLKKQICNKFKKAYSSRAFPNKFWYEKNSDNCEYWVVCLTDRDILQPKIGFIDVNLCEIYSEKSFNAINCASCGNYKYSATSGYNLRRLDDAINNDWQLVAQEIRLKMHDRLRCECSLFWWQ
jgi:hypothetical protein